MKTSSKEIAFLAVLFALITASAFLTLVPVLSAANIAVVPLILIIVTAQVYGLKYGVIASTWFGVISYINALIKPGLISQFFITAPYIPLVPRILIGISAYYSYTALSGVFLKKGRLLSVTLPSALSAAAGVITNTALLLGLLSLSNGGAVLSGGGTMNELIWLTVLPTNSVLELIVCAVAVPPITYALKRARILLPGRE